MARAILPLLLAACGQMTSPDPGTSCPSVFVPCGGDPTGTWARVRECSFYSPSCIADTTVASGSMDVDQFLSDGTFNLAMESDTTDTTYPPACYATGGPLSGQPCAQNGESCGFDSGGSCLCHGSNSLPASAGTWVANGTSFTIQYTDGTSRTFDFCVDGDTMTNHLTTPDSRNIGFYARR